MDIVSITKELRGAIQKKGSWPFWFAKGMRPLQETTVNKMKDLMVSKNGRFVLGYVLAFVGVIIYPQASYLQFPEKVHSTLGKAFPLPESYRVSKVGENVKKSEMIADDAEFRNFHTILLLCDLKNALSETNESLS